MARYILVMTLIASVLMAAGCRQQVPEANSPEPENGGAGQALESAEPQVQGNPAGESAQAPVDTKEEGVEPAVSPEQTAQDEDAKNTIQYAGMTWYTDLQAAMEKAKAEKKDLLLNFSGTDWCYWCQQLDKEVFSQEAFQQEAKKHFVFMLADYPADQSKLSEEQMRKNQQLAQMYGIQGFPTIYLARPTGEAYARTGYREGGAEAYVQHLLELKQQAAQNGRMQ